MSTKYRYRIESILASAGLAGAVDVIVGGEDVSSTSRIPRGCSGRSPVSASTAPAALYVGDHPVDGHAARGAGVRYVRVLSGEHFGDEHWTGIEPVATIPDIGGLPRSLDGCEEA